MLLPALPAGLNLRLVYVCVCVRPWREGGGGDRALNAAEVCLCKILANRADKVRSAPITDQQSLLSISTITGPTVDFHCKRSEEFFCRTQGRSICTQKPGEVFVTVVQFQQHRCCKEFIIDRSAVLHILH
jgi:hypothetical protein